MNRLIVLFFFLLAAISYSRAQTGAPKHHKIALFVPLYLDSVFNTSTQTYRFDKQFPKYISPGLEFYEGAQLALDSLEKEGVPLEVNIYDTRGNKSINQIAKTSGFEGTALIIGQVTSPHEVSTLAGIAEEMRIPFINTNLPNDAGITKNPYLVILNSTLRTHCQGIYRFLQKNYNTSRLVVFQKKGTQENILRSYFNDIEKNIASVPLKLKFVTLEDNFNARQLIPHLDSLETTICVGASLDESFAKNLANQLAVLNTTYPARLIGMPTWDILPFEKKEYMGLEILYSTPFYIDRTNKTAAAISDYFKTVMYSRPSDMVFRGYECLYHFGKLLAEHNSNLHSSIGEKKYKVFTEPDIQPVFLNKLTQGIDYFENKKLYFLKKLNGEVKAVY